MIRWLWRLVRWLAGLVVYVFLVLGILLAVLAIVRPQEASSVIETLVTLVAAQTHR